jgi:folate-binding protein YgfZ
MPEISPITTAYYPVPEAAYLRITGPDQSAFLQRQTTNDIQLLQPGRSLLAVLTTPMARILDVFHLLLEPEGSIGAISLPGRVGMTTRYLKSRIFFMDKVSVEDASAELAQLDLEGPGAAGLLRGWDIRPPAEGEIAAVEWMGAADLAVGKLRIISQPGLAGPGFRLLVPAAGRESLEAQLRQAGAMWLNEEPREILRVEAGLPGSAELSEAYTPLEIGLTEAVSGSKGCYTGQEVLARQVTYDKVTQRLAGLRLEAPVLPGAPVWVENRQIGEVTSAVVSPRIGPIALAVLRRPYHESGTQVAAGMGQTRIPARVTELPFNKA